VIVVISAADAGRWADGEKCAVAAPSYRYDAVVVGSGIDGGVGVGVLPFPVIDGGATSVCGPCRNPRCRDLGGPFRPRSREGIRSYFALVVDDAVPYVWNISAEEFEGCFGLGSDLCRCIVHCACYAVADAQTEGRCEVRLRFRFVVVCGD